MLGLLALLLSGCSDTVKKNEYTITGHIKGVPDDTKIYLFNMRQQINVDSAFTKNAIFTMNGKIDRPTHCVIMIPNSSKYADLIVENSEIRLESTFEDMYFQNKVTGGREQKLKNDLWKITGKYDTEYIKIGDSLAKNLYRDETHRNELRKRYKTNAEKSKELMRGFILEHPNSYFTLDLLYRNRQYIAKDRLAKVVENLENTYKDTEDAIAIQRFLKEGEVVIGESMVDFEANTLNGSPFKVSSITDNYIYLSFWNAGCLPCRKENRFFSENFESLPEHLKLISFSTDRTKEQWRRASEEDGIKWTNLSDLQGNNGRIAAIYGVQALPTSFLIGKDGKIIKKFTGYNNDSYKQILDAMAAEESN